MKSRIKQNVGDTKFEVDMCHEKLEIIERKENEALEKHYGRSERLLRQVTSLLALLLHTSIIVDIDWIIY